MSIHHLLGMRFVRQHMLYLVVLFGASTLSGFAQSAQDLVERSGIQGGIIVHLNATNGTMTADLRLNDRFQVQGLFPNLADVATARTNINLKAGYGPVSARHWSGGSLPYIDNLVNLIVAEDRSTVTADELFRSLAPNGVLLTKNINSLVSAGFVVSPADLGDDWRMATKPWPSDMDDWTHWLHGADNNAVSGDTLAEIPRNLQWIQSPRWLKSHQANPALSAMVSSKGRVFYIIDESAPGVDGLPDRWFLVARDAFNGTELWKKPIKEWGLQYWSDSTTGHRFTNPHQVMRRLVAVGDEVYVTLGIFEPVVALNAATGNLVRTYEGSEKAFEINCHDDKLVLAVNHNLDSLGADPDISIMAYGKESGTQQWVSPGFKGVRPTLKLRPQFVDTAMAVGGGYAFLADQGDIVAINLTNGAKAWRMPRPTLGEPSSTYSVSELCTLVYYDHGLFLGQIDYKSGKMATMTLRASDAATGTQRWEKTTSTAAHHSAPDVMIQNGMVWALNNANRKFMGLDPETGVQQIDMSAELLYKSPNTHHNCYRNKATQNLLIYGRNKGTEFFNFDGSWSQRVDWVRPSCRHGVLPANGMIYYPAHYCGCWATSKLAGMVATAPWENNDLALSGATEVEQGSAFGMTFDAELNASVEDWPTYRQAGERHAFQATAIAAQPIKEWTAKIGQNLTPPVIANGKVFLAARDTHKVVCLDATNGQTLWSRTMDGSVNSAPTYYKGRLLFGSEYGYIYCLDAATGNLIWKFQAAPEEKQFVHFDQLTSAWPSFGSLLVHDDRVYCTAGISTYINGGLFVYALDLNTGTPLVSKHLHSINSTVGEMVNTVNADILVRLGDQIHVRGMILDMETLNIVTDGIGDIRNLDTKVFPQMNAMIALGGFLDDSLFNSAVWLYNKASGHILSADQATIFGIDLYTSESIKSHKHSNFTPAKNEALLKAFDKTKNSSTPLWTQAMPIRTTAIIVGPNKLYLAGIRDSIGTVAPWAHFDGNMGAELLICSKIDGTVEQQIALPAEPIFDGMASANEKLFISCKDGTLVCMGDGSSVFMDTLAGWKARVDPDSLLTPEEFADQPADNIQTKNLGLYGFGINPDNPDSFMLPQIVFRNGHMNVDVHQNQAASDVHFVVETSADLKNWTEELIRTVVVPELLGEANIVTYEMIPSVNEQPKLFVRVRTVYEK